MTKRFQNKNVFVTGASQGIGHEICRQFASEGATVGMNALDEDETKQAADSLQATLPGSTIEPYPGDISDAELIQTLVRDFAEKSGGLDVFVANAGITVFAPFLDVKLDEFDHLLGVNLRGTYFSVQEAARQMIRHKTRGKIILMSSVCGIQSHANTSSYGATKAGIRHLAISLADELGGYGITVNAVAPGATANERTLSDENYDAGWAAVAPNDRVGQVTDVAHTTLFLADEKSSHVTGQTVVVDGGWTTTSPLPSYLQRQLKGQ